MHFSSALKSAADQSLASGQIGTVSHAALIAAANDPHVAPAAEAVASFHVGQALGSIDWSKLISQIQVLIPFIMQLIALFAKPVLPVTP